MFLVQVEKNQIGMCDLGGTDKNKAPEGALFGVDALMRGSAVG
ncbi:hypothetical protein [Enterovibrio norvegicus]|nr:hypothetical protein [Enterovibrio norvegicus]